MVAGIDHGVDADARDFCLHVLALPVLVEEALNVAVGQCHCLLAHGLFFGLGADNVSRADLRAELEGLDPLSTVAGGTDHLEQRGVVDVKDTIGLEEVDVVIILPHRSAPSLTDGSVRVHADVPGPSTILHLR